MKTSHLLKPSWLVGYEGHSLTSGCPSVLFRQRMKGATVYELYIIHPWHGAESLRFDDWSGVSNELSKRGFRFLWDYKQGREVLYADGGYRAQVFENERDITRSLNPYTNLPVLY